MRRRGTIEYDAAMARLPRNEAEEATPLMVWSVEISASLSVLDEDIVCWAFVMRVLEYLIKNLFIFYTAV